MSRTISTVKIAPSEADRVNALSQYVRSDLSKANAAIRRRDVRAFDLCVSEISKSLASWTAEARQLIERDE